MQRNHRVKWAGDQKFIGTGSKGQGIVIDGNKECGPSPMELMLLSAGSCACIDLVIILEKARQKVVDVWVDIGGDRREEMPHYFTDIEMHFVVKGMDVKEQYVKRAISLAMSKYCSASAQLAALAEIKTSYEIIEAETP
jgi:putative redox protein